jgi:hypothetical protein
VNRRFFSVTTAVLFAAVLAACQTTEPMNVAPVSSAANSQINVVRCELKQAEAEYKGTCAIPCMVNSLFIDIDGPTPGRTCDAPPRTVNASIKKTERANHWLGTMQAKEPEDPTRFEIVETANSRGVAKLPYGWFAIENMKTEPSTMSLTIATNKTLPPTQDDIKIIQRAIALIPSEALWNKADDRQCPKGQIKLSVFCALTQATQEIAGGIHYRQPAAQAVREVVNEVGGKRVGKHRLMDYNNHPDTTLAEIHTMLRMAQAKVEKRFR